MNFKKLLSTVAIASMLVACSSGSTSSSETTAFKIGCSGPLTGDAAVYGKAVKNAAELAVEEVNALGTDVQLEFKMEDDQADAEKSPTAYGTLKDWGMQIGLGTVTSGAGAAVSQNYVDDTTFAITPSGSSPTIIYSDDAYTQSYGYLYQMCFTDPNQGVASADYIQEHNLGTKVAIIYKSDDNYSTGIYQKFKAEAEKIGLSVVSETSFDNSSATDFNVQLKDAQSKGADVLYLPIYYQPASLILTQADKLGYDPTVFGVDGMDGILTLDGFDTSLAEGVYLLTPFSADATDELTANFVKNYEEKYGETPNQFAADAYDCIYAIYNALTEGKATADMSNSDIADILIEQFTSMTFDGVTGTSVTWSKTGEVSKSPKAVIIKDGAYVGVED